MPPFFPNTAVWLVQAFIAAFFAILFLQSGLDKVIDRRGNLDFLKGHFERTPLAKSVPMMFLTITILEVLSGVVCAIGFLFVLFMKNPAVAFWGVTLAAASLIGLFFGQRISKDYAGAAVLVPYLIVALWGMWVLG